MPEIKKPLYVQYTGDKYRENCCDECRMLLDENGIPIDRKGERFNRINENGIGVNGQPAKVRYILGDCNPYCTGNCYYVKEKDTGVEFIYKNIDGEMCDQDPPFTENDLSLETESVEERLKILKEKLASRISGFNNFTVPKLNELIEKNKKNQKEYNRHLDFMRLLSIQTQKPKVIARNKESINKEIVDLEKQIDEINSMELDSTDLSTREILTQRLEFIKDLIKPDLANFFKEYRIFNKIDDNFKDVKFPNVACKNGVENKKIKAFINASIYDKTDGKRISNDTIQNFTIDTTGANLDSGTTPVDIQTLDTTTGHYVTSATYNNVTGIIDLTWNEEPPIDVGPNGKKEKIYRIYFEDKDRKGTGSKINYDEYSTQLYLQNPNPNEPILGQPDSLDLSSIQIKLLQDIENAKEILAEEKNDIKDLKDEIIKTELELSIKNNLLSTLDQTAFNKAINTISDYARYINLALKRFAQ